jgi:hypothetical protein
MSRRPPRLARWIISAVTERNERPWLVADLMSSIRRVFRAAVGGAPTSGTANRSYGRLHRWSVGVSSQAGRHSNSTNPCQRSDPDALQPEKLSASLYHLRHAFRRLMRSPRSPSLPC